MPVNGIALAALAGGSAFLYAALENKTVLGSLKSVIQGQPLSVNKTINTPTPAASSGVGSGSSAGASSNDVTGAFPVIDPSNNNSDLGKMLAAPYGWSTGNEWDSLNALINRESSWDNTVWNGGSHAATKPAGSSGAYGIGQALPYTKMPKAAWPPGYGGQASASEQIKWTYGYIKDRYGSPSAAWAHETANGWY